MIDKQRVAAVKKLEELGYTFAEGEWMEPGHGAVAPKITDTLHALLVKRADEIDGCSEGSDDERELAAITNAIEAYEAVRWPKGRVDGWQGVTLRCERAHRSREARQLSGLYRARFWAQFGLV